MKVLENKQSKRSNFYEGDRTLQQILQDKLPDSFLKYADEHLSDFGALCAGQIDARAKVTDREGEPRLQRYNAYGEEVSEVIVNEGYKRTVAETYATGIVGYVHKPIPELNERGNYVYSFAQGYLLSQAEPGFYCPVTLSMATAYLIDHYGDEEVKKRFLPHVCATGDEELYEGATFLTERQGGSDVGANVVEARYEAGSWRLYGEKYFASNAGMCGVAMVLARQTDAPQGSKGLTLFAVPWRHEDGTLNGIHIRRLKDKLGVRAVPSGEVVFDGAEAFVVGDPSKGIYYMLEALNLSRICNAAASLGIMKRAYEEAKDYTEGRIAFGQTLTQYPMVQESLSTLQAKWHASLVTLFDLIERWDRVTEGKATVEEQALVRLLIALVKKETAEASIHFAHEAIELHGGNGYIEDFVTPRLLRDAQVLTVWEGTANILAHELLRLVQKNAHKVLLNVLQRTKHPYLQQRLAILEGQLSQFTKLGPDEQTLEAKPLMKEMAQLYEAVIAVEHGEKFGEREKMLAEIYIEQTWQQRVFGEAPLAVKYYEKLD
ncbi:acyl-CoA dehydrogenase family protein [Lysinibacillus sp. 54212]|uniref:acyl-CoA dehydrogenase family protein n=1 Tax=Lysinibacillus sp. 54212 TaxID=3119829 RepID=UPI002FC739F1